MAHSSGGNDMVTLAPEQADLLRMSTAAAIAGGMISTVNRLGSGGGPTVGTDQALRIFAEVYEAMYGRSWTPPKT